MCVCVCVCVLCVCIVVCVSSVYASMDMCVGGKWNVLHTLQPGRIAGSEGPDLGAVVNIGGGGDVLRKKDMEVMPHPLMA